MTAGASGGAAPAWCEDPQPWFSCPDCGDGLYWADFAHGQLLICANHQCFGAGIEIPVWRAQQHREDSGLDLPAPGPGWPRPILEGRPVPHIVPITAGRPWWRLTHGPRLLRCQNDWCCQVCGSPLDPTAWVLIDGDGAVETDAAAHQRCLQHALRSCPHLIRSAATTLHAIPLQRSDIHAHGNPLSTAPAVTREPWTVSRPGARSPIEQIAHAASGPFAFPNDRRAGRLRPVVADGHADRRTSGPHPRSELISGSMNRRS